ncbi:MAG: hypothetical protein KC492_02230, partial [Myxococcales bacterium]|nr:hypothetical protein [Myxococcales bacterium]
MSLPLLERHGDPSVRGWVESFGRVYATVETQCRERVTLPRPYLDEEGELRSNDRKMGWVEALLGLRNEMAHRALASQQIAEEDLSNFEPVMRNLLNAGAELTAWQLVEVLPAANTSPRAPLMAHPWTGRHGRGTPFEVQRPRHLRPFPEDGSLLGIATRNGTLLPLPVFYGREGQGQGSRPAHLLSFEGLSSRGIHYVAGDGSKRDDRRPLAAWNQLVSAISPPPDSLSLATMTWEVFVQRCATTTALTLAGLEERSVYHADLDTSRDAIDGAFLELLEERRAMLLVGAPGVGKTFALASHARRRIDAGDAVTLLRATDLEGTSPAAQVSNALGFPLGTTPEAIVAQLGAMSGRPGRWWLLVDGVESGSPSAGEWITAVSTWAEALGATDALRIVASTRTATFDGVSHLLKPRNAAQFVRRPRHDSAEPEQAVFVGAFDLDSTEEAYERHRKHAIASGLAAPLTRYIELGSRGNTRKVLRDPVAMRLLIRAYAGKPLPTDIPWEEAMELFLERTVRDPAEPDGGPRWKYLETIVEWCSRASVEELSREQLADHPRLGAAVFDTSMESPYAQLVDLGVLVEEWRDASCVVAVSPHRLFEHLLAGHLQCTSVERMLGDIRRLDGLRAAPGAWTTALHRTLRAGNAEIVVEALDACDHGRWKAAQAPLVQAVTQLLSNLAAHHEDELERFLETLVQVPSRTDVNLLLDAIEAARASGKIRALG